jgi:hypothetical protein
MFSSKFVAQMDKYVGKNREGELTHKRYVGKAEKQN